MSFLSDVVIWPVFMVGGFAIAAIFLLIALSLGLVLLIAKRRKSKAGESASDRIAVFEAVDEKSANDRAGKTENSAEKDAEAGNSDGTDREAEKKRPDGAPFEADNGGEKVRRDGIPGSDSSDPNPR